MTNVLMKGQIQRLATVELWRLVGRHVTASGFSHSLVSNQNWLNWLLFYDGHSCIDLTTSKMFACNFDTGVFGVQYLT